MSISVRPLLQQAFLRLAEEDKKKATTDVGSLRAGNTGVILDGPRGEKATGCLRLAAARALGIPGETHGEDRQLMFAGGRLSEEILLSLLQPHFPAGWVVRREEEIPTSWNTASGVVVSGRPDVVLLDGEIPQHVIEMKMVSSLWTARDVFFRGQPKVDHVAQATHYAWQLGLRHAEIVYVSYCDFAVPRTAFPDFPREDEPLSDLLEYNFRGEPKKVKPHVVTYMLDIPADEGSPVIYYTDTGEARKTVVTVGGIRAFFESASRLLQPGQPTPPRPLTLTAEGDKVGYSKCDYCDALPVCRKFEKGPADLLLSALRTARNAGSNPGNNSTSETGGGIK